MNFCKKALMILLLIGLLMGSVMTAFYHAEGEAVPSGDKEVTLADMGEDSYYAYYLEHLNAPRPKTQISSNVPVASALGDTALTEIDSKNGLAVGESNSWGEWDVDVSEPGVYYLYVNYYAPAGRDVPVNVQLRIDAERPFAEADSFALTRLWKDSVPESGKLETDEDGNDLRSPQVEVNCFQTQPFFDVLGMYSEPYLFYLTAGKHTIRLTVPQQEVIIESITFKGREELPSYEQYKEKFKDKPSGGQVMRQEAELTLLKNSRILYPTYDRTDCATLPNDAYNIRLNTIGQANWSSPGDYISWEANVTESGWYTLYFRARQNYKENAASYRRLYINGTVPFYEAENISFEYNFDWYVKALGGDTPLELYLNPGDIITMECSADKTCEISRSINQAILELNAIYRKIIVITGAVPDVYRDYFLDSQIPDLCRSLLNVQKLLDDTAAKISGDSEKGSANYSVLKELSALLKAMAEDPYLIPSQLTAYKDYIESMGSLLLNVGQHPLELDCFYFVPRGQNLPKTEASFWNSFKFSVSKFIASFSMSSKNKKSSADKKELAVWVSTGRDQMQIISNLIRDNYVSEEASVKLSLVDTGDTLIQATLAGKGPDAALMIPQQTPINLAMRGGLVALDSGGLSLDGIYENFYPEAWTPFRFDGKIYAIPETQVFDMLFYRKDIFKDLNITPPDTWEEFYEIIQTVQSNNLEVGIPEIDAANPGVSAGLSTFNRFLLQRGQNYYNDTQTETNFNSEEAYEAFGEWVGLYKTYGLERSFDFFNRFRSGEMPVGIAAYSFYNQLTAAAPEIRGLWSFAPVPGIKNADQSINRAEPSSSSACILLKSAEKKNLKNEGAKFLKWWTSDDIQKKYAQELEAIMGVSARYTPAGKKAFQAMNWSPQERSMLTEQWEQVVNIPEVPGNYVVPRSITNAFRNSLEQSIPRRQLDIYNKVINEEIKRKRKEFHLE